jgi:hypothetical protein
MKILLLAALCFTVEVKAQTTLTSDLVEGGKTIVDLIRVIKTPRTTITPASYMNPDSCGSKKLSDICFKNKTDKTIQVSLYLRTGNVYEIKPLLLNVSPSSKESLYEIRSGIYKYKIEVETAGIKTILHEGELKLQPCEKATREIK